METAFPENVEELLMESDDSEDEDANVWGANTAKIISILLLTSFLNLGVILRLLFAKAIIFIISPNTFHYFTK